MFKLVKIQFVMVLFYIVWLTSCATMQPTRFVSSVDSLAQPDALAKKRYLILPGNKNVEAGDLQFLEYAGYVEKVLNEKGFEKASSFDNTEIMIFLSYGIGNPQNHQYSYLLPMWGQTGVSSSTTYGTFSTYGGTGSYSGTTTYTPTYGITGYTSHVGNYTTYTRFLLMDAYDASAYKRDQRMNQLWKTTVMSTGSSNDLRLVFPYMAVAMKQYIGTNTGKKIKVEIPENNPGVIQLRGGASATPVK